MGCCNKKSKGALGTRIAARGMASRSAGQPTPVKRQIKPRPTARQMPEPSAPRPFNPMRYYVISLDGSEEVFNTLAEAQVILRRNGGPKAGFRVEPRRSSS